MPECRCFSSRAGSSQQPSGAAAAAAHARGRGGRVTHRARQKEPFQSRWLRPQRPVSSWTLAVLLISPKGLRSPNMSSNKSSMVLGYWDIRGVSGSYPAWPLGQRGAGGLGWVSGTGELQLVRWLPLCCDQCQLICPPPRPTSGPSYRVPSPVRRGGN